jgi:hypothetical protein
LADDDVQTLWVLDGICAQLHDALLAAGVTDDLATTSPVCPTLRWGAAPGLHRDHHDSTRMTG